MRYITKRGVVYLSVEDLIADLELTAMNVRDEAIADAFESLARALRQEVGPVQRKRWWRPW